MRKGDMKFFLLFHQGCLGMNVEMNRVDGFSPPAGTQQQGGVWHEKCPAEERMSRARVSGCWLRSFGLVDEYDTKNT